MKRKKKKKTVIHSSGFDDYGREHEFMAGYNMQPKIFVIF